MNSRLNSLVSRKSQDLSQIAAIRASAPIPGCSLGRVLEPGHSNVDLQAWVRGMCDSLREQLQKDGAILFRGFERSDAPAAFSDLARELDGELLEYSYRSTPRSTVEGRIYSSTEYPASQTIPQHNEMSYSRVWPLHVWFFSRITAESGGQTPLADSRRIYNRIPEAIRRKFDRLGILYVRNYGDGPDLGWREVFGTSSPEEVDRFCGEQGISTEWLPSGRLRTKQTCQATAIHPETGENVWFNQAHLFHSSSLLPEVRLLLQSQHDEQDLPRQCFLGDGSPLRDEDLAEIRSAIAAETMSFDWRQGDILLLDNMLMTHGRAPYVGAHRSVLVAMAREISSSWMGRL